MGLISFLFGLAFIAGLVYIIVSLVWFNRDSCSANHPSQLESIFAPALDSTTLTLDELFKLSENTEKLKSIVGHFVVQVRKDVPIHFLPIMKTRLSVLKSMMSHDTTVTVFVEGESRSEGGILNVFDFSNQRNDPDLRVNYLKNQRWMEVIEVKEKDSMNLMIRNFFRRSNLSPSKSKIIFIDPRSFCMVLDRWVNIICSDDKISTLGSRLVVPGSFGMIFVDQVKKSSSSFIDALTRKKMQDFIFSTGDDEQTIASIYIYELTFEFIQVIQTIEGGIDLHHQIISNLSEKYQVVHHSRCVLQSATEAYREFYSAIQVDVDPLPSPSS